MEQNVQKEVRLSRLFLLLAPILYAAYALLTPPFQTPDEHQHLFRAWQFSELQLSGERRGDRVGGELPENLGTAAYRELGTVEPITSRRIVERPLDALLESGTPSRSEASRFFNFSGAALYSPAGYLPQIGAIWIGQVLGLSVENIVRLGRLLNAALAILFIYCAIKVTPVGGVAFIWAGMLPMTASASAAFGQDGLAIGGACLLTAIGLQAVLNGRWQRSELVVTATLTLLITLSKILYLPLAMIGGQPFLRGRIELRRLLAPGLICLTAMAITGTWLHANSGMVVSPQTNIPPPSDRLALWLHQPTSFFGLMEQTYIARGLQLFDTLFTFGWLNVGPVQPAAFLSIAALVLVLLAGDRSADRLGWQTRLWLLLIAGSIVLLISVAVCLYWTRASDSWIQGLQARYFIPIMPAFLIALLPKRDADTPYGVIVALLMVAANLISLAAIITVYYR